MGSVMIRMAADLESCGLGSEGSGVDLCLVMTFHPNQMPNQYQNRCGWGQQHQKRNDHGRRHLRSLDRHGLVAGAVKRLIGKRQFANCCCCYLNCEFVIYFIYFDVRSDFVFVFVFWRSIVGDRSTLLELIMLLRSRWCCCVSDSTL